MSAKPRWIFIILGTAAASFASGCSDPVADAKRRLEIVEKSGGSSADICKAQKAIADAQLQAKNEADYPLAKVTADVACNRAKLDAAYGSDDATPLADNLEVEAANNAAGTASSVKRGALGKASALPQTGHDQEDPNDLVSRIADGTLDMCYKGYCPCEGEQGGPDMPLCDQLEQGIQPPVDLMIAGRAMREGRRQLEASGY